MIWNQLLRPIHLRFTMNKLLGCTRRVANFVDASKDNPTNPTTADLNNAITNLQNVINDAPAARDTAVKNAMLYSIQLTLADQAKDKTLLWDRRLLN